MNIKDKSKILEELGGIAEDLYDSLVEEYLSSVKKKIEEIYLLIENGNYAEAAKEVHSIKGASANLRLYNLYDFCLKAEEELKASLPDIDKVKGFLNSIAEVVE